MGPHGSSHWTMWCTWLWCWWRHPGSWLQPWLGTSPHWSMWPDWQWGHYEEPAGASGPGKCCWVEKCPEFKRSCLYYVSHTFSCYICVMWLLWNSYLFGPKWSINYHYYYYMYWDEPQAVNSNTTGQGELPLGYNDKVPPAGLKFVWVDRCWRS